MASVLREFEHLRIHLVELKKATDSFSSKVIGEGGFGKVYEGIVSHHKGRSIVAIKRLNRKFGQGDPEFWKEIMMLSRYKHKNLISLLGFCDEDGEKIIVYEHASNGSLDCHLSSTALTWTQRLKICLDVARGLAYLHDDKGTQQRVLHRDIKSANILLDENWNAKLADLGLSKIGPANQQHTCLFTNVVGTNGYIDPLYMETCALTKESDIYALGVVLFEVLCGTLCFKRTNGRPEIFVRMWKQSYKDKKLDQIIFKDLIPTMDPTSLKTFSKIAFQCLDASREGRPTISLMVEKLEIAFKLQEGRDMKQDNAVGTSQTYLNVILSKGKGLFLGKKWTPHSQDGSRECIEGKAIFSQLIKAEELAFLEKDDGVGSLQVIRRGGCGEVYKIELPKSKVKTIAIKKVVQPPKDAAELTEEDTKLLDKKMSQIKSEIQTVGKIRHRNLVPLLAHVSRPDCHYLVYEFMKNGSLQDILQQVKDGNRELDWLARHRIALGVAAGLEYLHLSHTPRIVHINIKPANVLLDDDMEARIANFGLAKSIPDADTHMTSSNVAGTLGYIAPEYHQTLRFTEKCDIYSFGVLLAVLVTGKLPSDEFFLRTSEVSIVKWLRNVMTGEDPKQAIDTNLLGNGYEEQMLLVLKIACFCTSDDPKQRPNSKNARLMLAQCI